MTKHKVVRAFTAFRREYKPGYVLTDADFEMWAFESGPTEGAAERVAAHVTALFTFGDIVVAQDEPAPEPPAAVAP